MLTILSSISPIAAQDATLEETIEWLNQFGFDRDSFTGNSDEAGIYYDDEDQLMLQVWTLEPNSNSRYWQAGIKYPVGICSVFWTQDNGKGIKYCADVINISTYEVGKTTEAFYIKILSSKHEFPLLIKYKLDKEDLVNRVDTAFKHLFKLMGIDENLKMIDKRDLENKF